MLSNYLSMGLRPLPMYEYACAKCGHTFTLRRRIAQRNDPAQCSRCQATETRRIISRTSVQRSSGSTNWGATCSGFT